MKSTSRRYEVLLPLQFNDGSPVPQEWLADAAFEVALKFGAASFETQTIKGTWINRGTTYRDDLARLVVDVADIEENREWMRAFRDRWKAQLKQLELWMVSYQVEVE